MLMQKFTVRLDLAKETGEFVMRKEDLFEVETLRSDTNNNNLSFEKRRISN